MILIALALRFDCMTESTPELILPYLHSHSPGLETDHSPKYDELQRDFTIQQSRPTDGKFDSPPRPQGGIAGKQHAAAGNVQGLAVARYATSALTQELIMDISFNWKSLGTATIG